MMQEPDLLRRTQGKPPDGIFLCFDGDPKTGGAFSRLCMENTPGFSFLSADFDSVGVP